MPWDPNDPNQDGQNPNAGDQSDAASQARNVAGLNQGIDQLVRSRPAVAAWLSAHNGGRNLSASDQSQLWQLIQQNGIQTGMLEIGDDGHFTAGTNHTVRDIVVGLTIAFGPLAVATAIPAVAGAVGGTGATVAGVEGGAYGVGADAVAALGTGAMATVPVTAATTAAINTAAATIGPTAAKAAAAKVAASGGVVTTENILKTANTGGYSTDANGVVTDAANVPPDSSGISGSRGVTYGDILKYALPQVGQVINGVIQSKATGAASDAQQKYLEEALAYQKEQDAYTRATDAARYSDTRGDLAARLALEAQRYGAYQGRIKGFIDNGQNSNDRMSALLGLSPRANVGSSAPSYASRASDSGSQGGPVTPDITAGLDANYKALGLTAGGRGSGPTDRAYYADQIAATGGLTEANKGYWFGTNGRIASDAAKAGLKGTPAAPTVPTSPPPVTTQPQARAASVLMRAPDGSSQSVPANQVDHYTQRGATPIDQGTGATVQMRGPDGSVKTVPADQVPHYQQLGATVLGVAA